MKKILLAALAAIITLAPAMAGTFRQSYPLRDFTGVSASHIFHVEISPAPTFSVKVEAPDYLEPYINVTVDRKQLTFSVKSLPRAIERKLSDEKPGAIRAFVSMPVLESISLSGAARLECLGDFPDLGRGTFRLSLSGATHADGLSVPAAMADIRLSGASHASLRGRYTNVGVEASGASKAKFGILAPSVKAELSGSARLDLDGEFDVVSIEASGASQAELLSSTTLSSLDIECSGASSVESRKARALDVSVELSGASKCRVSALKSITVDASGASTCYYEAADDTKVNAVSVSRGASLKKL